MNCARRARPRSGSKKYTATAPAAAPARTASRDGPPRLGRRRLAAVVCLRICVFSDSSAVAPSSRAAFPAPLPNSFAARLTRSTTSSRTCFRSTCFKSSTTRHPLSDFRGRLVLGRLHQVAMTQDTNQAAVLRDREPTDFLALHHAGGLLDIIVGTDDGHVAAHQVLGRFASGVVPLRDAANQDVTIRNHANHGATVFDHRDEPGVFLLHLPGDVDHFVALL